MSIAPRKPRCYDSSTLICCRSVLGFRIRTPNLRWSSTTCCEARRHVPSCLAILPVVFLAYWLTFRPTPSQRTSYPSCSTGHPYRFLCTVLQRTRHLQNMPSGYIDSLSLYPTSLITTISPLRIQAQRSIKNAQYE